MYSHLWLVTFKLNARHEPTRLLSETRNASSDGVIDVNRKPWQERRLIDSKVQLRLSALLCMLHVTDFSGCVDGDSKRYRSHFAHDTVISLRRNVILRSHSTIIRDDRETEVRIECNAFSGSHAAREDSACCNL